MTIPLPYTYEEGNGDTTTKNKTEQQNFDLLSAHTSTGRRLGDGGSSEHDSVPLVAAALECERVLGSESASACKYVRARYEERRLALESFTHDHLEQ